MHVLVARIDALVVARTVALFARTVARTARIDVLFARTVARTTARIVARVAKYTCVENKKIVGKKSRLNYKRRWG